MEVQEVKQTEETVITAMTDFCKAYLEQHEIARRKGLNAEDIQKEKDMVASQLEKEIQKQPQLRGITLTDDIISKLYDSHAVDVVPLLNNSKASNFNAISMYVDDQGVAKNLPVNVRGSALCSALNRPVQVMGDCWVARYYDDDDDFIRFDMTFDDLEEENPMIVLAKKLNAQSLNESNKHAAQIASSMNSVMSTKCAEGRYGCSQPAKNRCSRCKRTHYCSAAHQKEDWSFHKNHCYAPSK